MKYSAERASTYLRNAPRESHLSRPPNTSGLRRVRARDDVTSIENGR